MRIPLVAAMVLVMAIGVAWAGEFHSGANLICSQCHTMHASLQHNYTGGTTADPFGAFPQSWAPTSFLLKAGSENALCLTCHDSQSFAEDVYGTDGGPGRSNRSAGALNDAAGIVTSGYEAWMGHTLGYTGTAPGTGTATFDLKCVDCHHQHGFAGGGATDVNGTAVTSAYRNLRGFGPFGAAKNVSYAVSATFPGNNADVWIKATSGLTYETESIHLMEPNPNDSGFGTWCSNCHGDFHGDAGVGAGPDHFIRHPQAKVNIGALGGGHSSVGVLSSRAYRVRVMSATDISTAQGTAGATLPTDLTPTCLSCHKAHGNQRAFGLIYADGTGTALAGVGENGAGTARTLCMQCHVQGG